MTLSIIVPSYNEPTIALVLERLCALQLPGGLECEIILVDDGSTDLSIRNAEAIIARSSRIRLFAHDRNRGKGAAIKTALQHCKGDIIIIQDADLEYDTGEIIKVIEPVSKHETLACYGSRHLDKSLRRKNFLMLRKHFGHSLSAFLGGRFITLVCDILFFVHLTDVLTCYKAFSAPLIKSLDLKCSGFDLETELTAKILKKTKIREVPVHYYPRTKNEGKKIRLHDGLKSLAALVRFRFVN